MCEELRPALGTARLLPARRHRRPGAPSPAAVRGLPPPGRAVCPPHGLTAGTGRLQGNFVLWELQLFPPVHAKGAITISCYLWCFSTYLREGGSTSARLVAKKIKQQDALLYFYGKYFCTWENCKMHSLNCVLEVLSCAGRKWMFVCCG